MKNKDFLEMLYKRHSGNVKLGLDRMYSILGKMNNPHEKLQGIHIAGTNGKGSTAAMCEAIGLAHGFATGLNTSPHLVEYNERIRIMGKNISLQELKDCYIEWQAVFDEFEASFFEITTAMAFYIFAQKKIKLAIFEVGLGGRLDGTNPFLTTVSAITSISYDHPKSLGESVEKIAYEKAGIIKNGIPVIIGKMNEIAELVIKQKAKQKNAPYFSFGEDFNISNIFIDEYGTNFDYQSPEISLKNVSTNLLGTHQAYNAAIAIKCFTVFSDNVGQKIDANKIRKGLKNVNWPGRMQILYKDPLIILDGAHNEEGILALKQNLIKMFPGKKLIIVLAILRDKKINIIMKNLSEIANFIVITKNKSSRAAEIEEQVEILKKFTNNYVTKDSVIEATIHAMKLADDNSVIIVSGSLYTISELLQENALQ